MKTGIKIVWLVGLLGLLLFGVGSLGNAASGHHPSQSAMVVQPDYGEPQL